ncbi:MAG: Asparagine synthetase [glutamine-hydrolyzing] 1 [Calditrichaeota bacterium]|nr:Asparagine synthetase [glutamine-hydrolyzing] 1 [Calditrichota bacterium]
MAFSIEARVPHLSAGMIDFALTLPPSWQVRGGWTKFALRKAMENRLPENILWNRRKQGFPIPQEQWVRTLRPHLNSWLEGLPPDSPLNTDALFRAIDNGQGGAFHIWKVVSVAMWISLFSVRC